MAAELARQRDALTAELAELESAFGTVNVVNGSSWADRARPVGRPRGSGRRGRGRNANSLVETLRNLLSGSTMSVSDVAQAAQTSGYQTKSANFRTIVNQALLANPKLFRKVARGQYTAR